MAQDIASITGSITATLYGEALRDMVNSVGSDVAEGASRETLIAALTDTVTDTIGLAPWGTCNAKVTDEGGTVTVAFSDDRPAGVIELCETLASWFEGLVDISSDEGLACIVLRDGRCTVDENPALVAARDRLWLGQFIYEDGSTFVHICRSEDAAFQALAGAAGLEIGEGQTAEQTVGDHFDESYEVTYLVTAADSINL